MNTVFKPPMPPLARYSGAGCLIPGDDWTYFRAMSRNPLEVWGEHHFHLNVAPFRFLGRSSLIINDPDAIQHCFIGNVANYRMNPMRQAVLRPLLRDGLLTAKGEIRKTARKAVFSCLHTAQGQCFRATDPEGLRGGAGFVFGGRRTGHLRHRRHGQPDPGRAD